MDYCRNEGHVSLTERIEQFCKQDVAPSAMQIDEEQKFPAVTFKKMGERGFLGLLLPKAFGGGGADIYSHAIVLSALAKSCGSTAESYGVHAICSYGCIARSGSEDQKRRYLPLMISGEKIGALAITEPLYGSDISGTSCTVEVSDDNYIITGQKKYIVNGSIDAIIIVTGSLNNGKGKKRKSIFIVETPIGGLESRVIDTMGGRGCVISDLMFNRCIIPRKCLLGKESEGLELMMSVLDLDRIDIAIITCSIAEASLAACIDFSKKRIQFGKPIADFQAIRFKLAEMGINIKLAKCLIQSILDRMNEGAPCSTDISIAKVFASEMATQVTLDAIQIHGGYGYTKGAQLERCLRDVKGLCIGGGTSEMQKLIIARELLK